MFILLYPFLYKTKRFIRKREKELFNFILFQYIKYRFLITLQRYDLYFN